LILLAFLLPLAIYLLLLGTINRRRRPLMVSGPWDFVGVLFAASGFLLFGGPGALSVLNDRWRDALVYGQNPSSATATTESLWDWWLFFMAAYFVVVVAGAAYFLWRARNQTSIYNVDLETIQTSLARIFERLGLRPLRSGDMYYFGMTNRPRPDDRAEPALEAQRIQTTPSEAGTSLKVQTAPTPMVSIENVILEVDAFRLMWHVTLRWDPAHSGLRQAIERELDRELAETPAPYHALGGWLSLMGCGTFLLMLLVGIGVLIYRFINHVL
jgi:hypothetical protein